MKRLTNKEKEIMDLYWQHGPMFVKELLDYYDEPLLRRAEASLQYTLHDGAYPGEEWLFGS